MDRNHRYAFLFTYIGRFFLALAFLGLCGAWIAQVSGRPLLGMSQQHLFNDSMALSLLGVGLLLDGLVHFKGM